MDPKQEEMIHEMAERITHLENKVDRLLMLFERTTGAWMLIKVLGSAVVGCASLWAFLGDHITFK